MGNKPTVQVLNYQDVDSLPPAVWTRVYHLIPFPALGRLTLTSKAWRALYHQFLDEIDLSAAGAHKIVSIPQVVEVLFASSSLSTSGSSRTSRVSMSDRPTPRTTQQKITSIYFCKRNLTDDQEKILAQVAERFTNLQSLVLSGCFRLEDRTIQNAASLVSLTNLDLSETKTITDDAILRTVSSLTKLESLNLSNCARLTSLGLDALVSISKSLKRLNLKGCTLCTTQKAMGKIGKLSNLESLSLANCRSLSDPALEFIGGLTELVDLDLSMCISVSDNGLRKFASKLPKLEKLNLSGCDMLTDTAWLFLAPLTQLKNLDFSNCDNLTALYVKPFKNLRRLDLRGCNKISQQWENVKRLKKLEYLCLNDCKVKDLSLFAKMINLRYLYLCRCSFDGADDDASHFSVLANLKNLEVFGLDSCLKLTDQNLKVCQEMPQLRVLSLSGTSVSGKGLSYLAKCPNLLYLGIAGCVNVGHDDVATLAKLSTLNRLVITETGITDPADIDMLTHKFFEVVFSSDAQSSSTADSTTTMNPLKSTTVSSRVSIDGGSSSTRYTRTSVDYARTL
eukprot:TRINITY_DN2508_c0_g1_i1.p1 TRINITY_DN2508_c0_g1~~TRINITY_DN2508_c0_g1_i1.p1  ORF type:complete len:572 (+),score=78.98 TRINITY_DN2508_c0_g1_i1:23-1717(+)